VARGEIQVTESFPKWRSSQSIARMGVMPNGRDAGRETVESQVSDIIHRRAGISNSSLSPIRSCKVNGKRENMKIEMHRSDEILINLSIASVIKTYFRLSPVVFASHSHNSMTGDHQMAPSWFIELDGSTREFDGQFSRKLSTESDDSGH
jgi:hypothetical protein